MELLTKKKHLTKTKVRSRFVDMSLADSDSDDDVFRRRSKAKRKSKGKPMKHVKRTSRDDSNLVIPNEEGEDESMKSNV